MATPLEQQMNGVDKMLYMQSTNANDGTMTLVVTFDVESDVEHRPGQRAEPRRPGRSPTCPPTSTSSASPTASTVGLPLVVFALYSPNGSYDSLFLGNYALINVNDALYRVPRRRPGGELRRSPSTRCGSG